MYFLVLCMMHGYWYVVRPGKQLCGEPRDGEAENILDGRYGQYKVLELSCPHCHLRLRRPR